VSSAGPRLGRIKLLDPRSVWANEARDFTPWLLENADALADALGLDIELTAAEHPVGPFYLDLIGRDLTNDCLLIVENQLSATDHGHLGQLITYAANLDAATIVWAAPEFREEHRQALSFLNNLGAGRARFFGVEIAVARIGESLPAPLFKLAAEPNDLHSQASSEARQSSQDLTGKPALYAAFWERFLERVKSERPHWTRSKNAPAQNWFSMPTPFKDGNVYSLSFGAHARLRCELYLDSLDPERVGALFSGLAAHKAEIEASFGEPLSWEDLPNRRAKRIAAYRSGDITTTAELNDYLDWFISTGTRLRAALDPYASHIAAVAEP
jgi:hypothetical protein